MKRHEEQPVHLPLVRIPEHAQVQAQASRFQQTIIPAAAIQGHILPQAVQAILLPAATAAVLLPVLQEVIHPAAAEVIHRAAVIHPVVAAVVLAAVAAAEGKTF